MQDLKKAFNCRTEEMTHLFLKISLSRSSPLPLSCTKTPCCELSLILLNEICHIARQCKFCCPVTRKHKHQPLDSLPRRSQCPTARCCGLHCLQSVSRVCQSLEDDNKENRLILPMLSHCRICKCPFLHSHVFCCAKCVVSPPAMPAES